MARPEIKGLKYFPFDTGFFEDKKIRLLRGEHGAEGLEVYQRLLCKIYSENGYFLLWDDDDDYALLADDTGIQECKLRAIVATLLRRSLLDKLTLRGNAMSQRDDGGNLSEAGNGNDLTLPGNAITSLGKLYGAGNGNDLCRAVNVLTSRSIQRRYFLAICETKEAAARKGRHTVIEKGLCLLNESDFAEINKSYAWLKVAQNEPKSPINPSKSPINPSKSPINSVKKRKEKKTTTTAQARENENPVVVVKPFSVVNYPDSPDAILTKYFTNNIMMTPSKSIIDKLCSWLDTFPPEVVIKAMDVAIEANKRDYRFVNGILRNWERDGLLTLSLIDGHDKTLHANPRAGRQKDEQPQGDYPDADEMYHRWKNGQ